MPGVLGNVCRDRQGAFVSAPTFIRNNSKESAVYMNSRVSPPTVRVGSELEIRHSMRELVRQAVLEGLGNRSFMVDTDADLMGLIGAAGLANGLSQPERQAMSEFGQGFGLPWLVLRGLPLQEQLPKTPQGYGQGQAVPTELLLFDNYRVLHRRKSFDPGSWDEARWLRRCFGTTDPSGGQFVDRLHRPYVWQ